MPDDKKQTITNFSNMETAIKTYDRNASVCGTPAWRYAYHAIHSADKWFSIRQNSQNPVFTKTEWIIPIILAMLF